MKLLIVESPTKARTIGKFLSGGDYRIEASIGHIRDLPASAREIPPKLKSESWARLGIQVENGFEPLYVIPSTKKKVVTKLKAALRDADEVLIATDEDREGESIGWHLLEVLKPKVPARRMVFHEITRKAIESALATPRDINMPLVRAQETRRVLDRLVGYSVSPVLWRKIAPKLAAGRVQSVAVRMIVQRERERIVFVPGTYWDIGAKLSAVNKERFEATLTHLQQQRLATGKDFDDGTGQLKEGVNNILLLEEKEARRLEESLPHAMWQVAKVEVKNTKRRPSPPFITSTLQQEASNKLGFKAQDTMRIAQRLYEQGMITYMRTDSVNLSEEAIDACRRAVERLHGTDYLSSSPRQFKGKVRNAQEAHEAIRPSGNEMKTAQQLGLTDRDAKLYSLIWKRTVATQMADCRLRKVTASIKATLPTEEEAMFRAVGQTVEFAGFLLAYKDADDPDAVLKNISHLLPDLKEGEKLSCYDVSAKGHETKPPARYTEASLIKKMESEGIGRPSTYATIIKTIEDRGSVVRSGTALVPTLTAFATNKLMENQFGPLVDPGFTAGMEQDLDDIAADKQHMVTFLENFYAGKKGLEKRVRDALDVDPKEMSLITFPKWGKYVVRVGKYGAYVEGEVDGEVARATLPEGLLPSDITEEKLVQILQDKKTSGRVLGLHPDDSRPVLLCQGRYGPYVQLGDEEQQDEYRRVSLPEAYDSATVTLEQAVALLRLPRILGSHPETAEDVDANMGRYGPYVRHQRTFASLKKTDDVLEVGLERALELLAEKQSRFQPLRVLGPHPEDNAPVEIWKGRYGPYVKHNRLNATIGEDGDPETITLERALELLAEKAAKKKNSRGRGRRKKR